MFLARPCPGCGNHRWYPCPGCVADLERAPAIDVRGARTAHGLASYRGAATGFIAEAKDPAGRRFVRWWADAIAATARDDLDLITWVPASKQGRRLRGHDQAAVLARCTGRRLGRRSASCLGRVADRHQTGLRREDRLAVRFEATRELDGARVLLVDDVHTTGASVTAAVDQLLQAGASAVDVKVLAVVERRGARPV